VQRIQRLPEAQERFAMQMIDTGRTVTFASVGNDRAHPSAR
jgi:hypothetical protein